MQSLQEMEKKKPTPKMSKEKVSNLTSPFLTLVILDVERLGLAAFYTFHQDHTKTHSTVRDFQILSIHVGLYEAPYSETYSSHLIF